MRARALRLLVTGQVLLLMASLLVPALAYAEEPPATADPTPTEQPSEPATPDPTEPSAPEPDPTAAPASDPPQAPTIASDLADYPPGGLVTLTGSNWLSGESVHIYVNDEIGSTWSRRVDVTADGDGDIRDQFNLPDWFVANYVVIATGSASGVAVGTFTDSNPQSITVANPTSQTLTQGSTATYGTVTVTVGGNSNPCTVTYGVTPAMPSGAAAVFTPTSGVTTGGDLTAALQITTSASTPSGTYSFRVTGTNSGSGCQGTGATNSNPITLIVNAADSTAAQPTLIAPANGSATSDSTPTFDWSDVSDPSSPVTYRMQYVGKGATCDFTAATTTGVLSASSFTPAASIGSDGVYCWRAKAFDNLGNDSGYTAPFEVRLDTAKPVITATATKADATAYVAGTWTNQSVTVSFSCADSGGSGLATDTVGGGGTQSAETATGSFTNTGACIDNAGNSADSVTFGPIMIDKTAPVISSSAANADSSPYVAGTWTNQSVTVSFSCADAGSVQSGIATNTVAGDNQTLTAETSGSNVSSNGDCVDNAGNVDTSETFGPIMIDKTAPVISSSAANADSSAYVAGTWTNQSVTVSFSCADTGSVQSGIATNTVAGDNQTLAAETGGSNVSSNGDCVDNAGNADTSETFGPVQIDKTAPVISGAATPGANANGWNIGSVSVTFTCADTGSVQSGIATDTVSGDNQTLTAETSGTTVTSDGDCVDNAGNADTGASVGPIRIDLTNPSVAITAPASGHVTVMPHVVVSGTQSDTPSGIDTVVVNGVTALLGAGSFTAIVPLSCGANTIAAVATDLAGRTSTSNSIVVNRVCAASLQYYQPIDQSTSSTPIVNVGKFGRVIPVKVTGTLSQGGSPVAMTESFLLANGLTLRIGVNGASCGSGAASDSVEAYADAGSSNDNTNEFRWSTSQWIYNLDTGNAPSVQMQVGSCYRLDVRLTDAHGGSVLLSSGPATGAPYAVFKPVR